MDNGLTDLQYRFLSRLHGAPNRTVSLTQLGGTYKIYGDRGGPTIGRLAAHSIAKSLERRGLVLIWRSNTGDQWARLNLSITEDGQRLLYCPRRK